MAVCSRDPRHVYPDHNKTCPWCQQQQSATIPQQTAMAPVKPTAPTSVRQRPQSAPVSASKAGRPRRTSTAIAPLAVVGVVVVGVAVALAAAQDSPGPNTASGAAQSEAVDTTTVVTEEPEPVSRAVAEPSADLHSGAESRYSADYAARVDAVSHDGLQVHVDFSASGRSDLRRPETSCLVITGTDGQTYIARPTQVALTTDERGNFAGRLSFPAIVTGAYGFQYSCSSDYSTAEIGSVNVPAVGVSRFSEDYYAVVLGFDGTRIQFAVHGRSDLRGPGSSCISLDGQSFTPEVAIESEWSNDAITLAGAMEFSQEVAGWTFVYSCSGYSEVHLG